MGRRRRTGMKRVMISQPMNGLSDEEITLTQNRAYQHLRDIGYDVVNTLFLDYPSPEDLKASKGIIQPRIFYLSNAVREMSKCDAVYFVKGWRDARGCKIEHEIAKEYGLELIYEEEK